VPARAVMGPCQPESYTRITVDSAFYGKYQGRVERRSAAEIVDEKMAVFEAKQEQEKAKKEVEKSKSRGTSRRSSRQTPMEAAKTQASRTLAREGAKLLGKLANGILNALFKKK